MIKGHNPSWQGKPQLPSGLLLKCLEFELRSKQTPSVIGRSPFLAWRPMPAAKRKRTSGQPNRSACSAAAVPDRNTKSEDRKTFANEAGGSRKHDHGGQLKRDPSAHYKCCHGLCRCRYRRLEGIKRRVGLGVLPTT